MSVWVSGCVCVFKKGGTYDGDDVLLDGGREGDQLEVEGEVELLCGGWLWLAIGIVLG